jgi:hypothetical protein
VTATVGPPAAAIRPEAVRHPVGNASHSHVAGTWVYTIKLSAGRWTEFAVFNNGPSEIGWAGRYQVVDDHTVVATDDCGPITYRFKLDGDKLTLDMVDDKCQGQDGAVEQGELIAQTIIYESAPFTKVG